MVPAVACSLDHQSGQDAGKGLTLLFQQPALVAHVVSEVEQELSGWIFNCNVSMHHVCATLKEDLKTILRRIFTQCLAPSRLMSKAIVRRNDSWWLLGDAQEGGKLTAQSLKGGGISPPAPPPPPRKFPQLYSLPRYPPFSVERQREWCSPHLATTTAY